MQDVQRDHFPFPDKMYQELPRIQVYGHSDLFFSNLLFICLFGGHAGHLAGSLHGFSLQRLNPRPLQCEHRVLNTG